jgi:PleD family two-component response regulator
MNLRVLLVEPDPEEVLFLQDVLREVEEDRSFHDWLRIEVIETPAWKEAERILAAGLTDVVLLAMNLSGQPEAETFRRSQSVAPEVPVILLADREDQPLAAKLIREGAQDYLIRREIDCIPLAHALRNAIERHRLLTAARAATQIDALTGLASRAAFLAQAGRDRRLAERLDRRWMVLVAALRNLPEIARAYGEQRQGDKRHAEQERDLELVEAADHLRRIAEPTGLLARIGENRFALAVFDSETESLEEAWSRIRGAALERHIDIGASIFDRNRRHSLETMLEQAERDLSPARPPAETGPHRRAGAA